MNDAPIAGPNLEGLHPLVFRKVGGYFEVLIRDLAGGRDVIWRGHPDHGVRRADHPALRKYRLRRHRLQVTRGSPRVHPTHDEFFFRRAQSAIVRPGAVRRVCVPRRHRALHDVVLDRTRPGSGVLIGNERHRRDLARPVTGRAVLVKDRRDVLGEGHRRSGSTAGVLCHGGRRRECEESGHHPTAESE